MRHLTQIEIDLVHQRLTVADNFEAAMGFDYEGPSPIDLATAESQFWPLVVEHDRKRLLDVVSCMRSGQSNGMTQFEVRPGDAASLLVECVWSVQRNAEGLPLKVIVACARAKALDIDGPSEHDARYRTALRAGRMGSWETDLAARTRIWTTEGMALFGLDLPAGRGQVGGEHDEYLAALHPEDRHLAREMYRLADEQDSFPAEYRIVRPDGATVWLSGRGLVVARQDDGRARRLVSIMADVTERRHAEEALRIERLRLAQALQAGRMGAFDLDITADVLWWSPQTYAVFGVDAQHFNPTRDSVAALVHPDDREAFVRLRAEAIATRQPFMHEFRIVRPDGAAAWIGHLGQAEYDSTGCAVRSFGVAMDITARVQSEQLLRDADRKKDNFIATLAHELRNPLAPMRSAVQVMRSIDAGNAQLAWCRDLIERQVEQMARLLDDLLDVSRLTRGRFALRREPLDLARAIEQAIEMARPHIDQARHELVVSLPKHSIAVLGDLTRLAQVFSNLLINAAKYTPAQGHIALNARTEGQDVVVTVDDTGIGIDADQLTHIFEMFGQVESALNRAQGGLGIGLSLAKGLVEMHGGRLDVNSAGAGQGSQFVVRLPLRQDPDEADAEKAPVADSAPRGRVRRVLIADDLADSTDSLAMLLQLAGHAVCVAYDGEQAVTMADSFRPDVVLLDLGMPKLNGLEAGRRIRQQPWGHSMTLIAHTGWGQVADQQRSREAGFDHHFVKPIDLQKLLALLSQLDTSC